MNSKAILFCMILIAQACVLSCGSESNAPTLDHLEITSTQGTKLDISVPETAQLKIYGFDKGNNSLPAENPVWSASNSNASVSPEGLVTPLAVGNVTITATVETVSESIELRIWDSTAPRTEIYVSDAGNFDAPPWKILRYDENGDYPEVFIDDQLGWPQDIIFLEDQEVMLVSNLNNGNIVKFDINTGSYLGVFANAIDGPTRMKIGPDKLLYVLQWSGNGRVLRYNLNGELVDEFNTVGVPQSIGLAWDPSGNLLVSSFNDGVGGFVRKFDPDGNDLGLFISSNLVGPTNIWFNPTTGELLINDWSGGAIRRFNASGNFLGNFAVGLSQPEGVDFLDGNVLIGNGGTSQVKVYTTAGAFVENLFNPGAGGLIKPNAVAVRKVNQ